MANVAITTYAFCASFIYTSTLVQYFGTFNVIPASGVTGAYLILSGNGNVTSTSLTTGAFSYNYSWVVESFGIPYDNLIYPSGSPLVDTIGISLLYANPAQTVVIQTVISASPVTGLYLETQNSYYSTVTYLVNRGASVAFAAGTTLPTCVALAGAAATNVVSPAQAGKITCSFPVSFGDSNTLDYATRREGSSINGNTVYSVPFTAPAGVTLTQMSLSILSNSGQSAAIRMGLYDPSGNLLFLLPRDHPAGRCRSGADIQPQCSHHHCGGEPTAWRCGSNTTLYVAYGASSTSAAAATYSSASLPTTFTPSVAGPTIPLSITGCATPTHTFCSYFQYYFPAVGTAAPYAYTSIYSGQLIAGAATSTSFGTGYPVQLASGHLQSVTGGYAGNSNPNTYTTITLYPGSTSYVYPTSTTGAVDTNGLFFLAGTRVLTLRYNSATGVVQENSTVATVIFSNVTFAPYSTLIGVPACSLFNLPHKSTANAAITTCPAGSSVVSYGDDNEADLADNTEGLYQAVANTIFLRPFTSVTKTPSVIYQLAFGINQNINTILKVKLALYDASNNFLVSTNEIQIWNPVDQIVVGQLTTPWTLAPNTGYNIALWADTTMFCGFTPGGSPAQVLQYNSTSWPAVFLNQQSNSVRAVQAFGCSATATLGSTGGSTPVGFASSSALTPTGASTSTGGSPTLVCPAATSSSSSGSSSVEWSDCGYCHRRCCWDVFAGYDAGVLLHRGGCPWEQLRGRTSSRRTKMRCPR